jgi:CubicO group peptidase (beta-lactamase class C family)
MRRSLGILLVVAGLLSACTPIRTEPEPARPDPLADYINQAVSTERFRGAVEVRDGAKVLLRRGFGMADPATKVPNSPATRFRIGSVTKQFTALAILKLQEQGKLNVVDRVCSYLPNCPPQWAPITIDQVLTHRAGLPNYTNDPATLIMLFGPALSVTPEQLLAVFSALPLDFPPGTKFSYTNSGYVLLGYLVEKISGKPYGDFLRAEILDPLGMSDTAYQAGLEPGPQYAVGYRDWENPAISSDDAVWYAAGGMYSTVTDLGRWQRFLVTGDPPVVRQETLAELLRPRVAIDGMSWYGYGIESSGANMAAIDSYSHNGAIPGYSSYVEVHPASGVTVTVLANLDMNVVDFGRNLAQLVPKQR